MANMMLTGREQAVLKQLAEGGTAKIIARSLGISPRTVEKYVDCAKIKMGARNRPHLMALVVSGGLLENSTA